MSDEIKETKETEEKKENRMVTFVKAHWKEGVATLVGVVAGTAVTLLVTTDKTGVVKALAENPIGFGSEGTEDPTA